MNNVRDYKKIGNRDFFQVDATVKLGAGFLFFHVPFESLYICTYTNDFVCQKGQAKQMRSILICSRIKFEIHSFLLTKVELTLRHHTLPSFCDGQLIENNMQKNTKKMTVGSMKLFQIWMQ